MLADAFEKRLVQTSLGRLAVKTAGEGPPILLWPSLLMSGGMWDGVAERLRGSYRVIIVDPPGQGDSEPLTRRFPIDESAECIPTVLDALDIPRAHYVGNSWGGMIGGVFAARHPERVGVAILMNATAAAAPLRQKLEYAVLVRIILLSKTIPSFMYATAVKSFLGPTAEREQPQLADYIRSVCRGLTGPSVAYAIDSVVPRRPDQVPLFARIRTPVCVVAGEEDRTFPVAETKAMADAIPGATFVCLPKVAHLAGLEQPAQVAALIQDFAGRHPI